MSTIRFAPAVMCSTAATPRTRPRRTRWRDLDAMDATAVVGAPDYHKIVWRLERRIECLERQLRAAKNARDEMLRLVRESGD